MWQLVLCIGLSKLLLLSYFLLVDIIAFMTIGIIVCCIIVIIIGSVDILTIAMIIIRIIFIIDIIVIIMTIITVDIVVVITMSLAEAGARVPKRMAPSCAASSVRTKTCFRASREGVWNILE